MIGQLGKHRLTLSSKPEVLVQPVEHQRVLKSSFSNMDWGSGKPLPGQDTSLARTTHSWAGTHSKVPFPGAHHLGHNGWNHLQFVSPWLKPLSCGGTCVLPYHPYKIQVRKLTASVGVDKCTHWLFHVSCDTGCKKIIVMPAGYFYILWFSLKITLCKMCECCLVL